MLPVTLAGFDLSLNGKALRQAASAVYKSAANQGTVRMRDGRFVELTSVGFKKVRSHSADRRVLDLLPSIRDLLAVSDPIGSAPPRNKPNSLPSILAYHYYGAWVTLRSVHLYAKLVVRESINGQIFYDTNLCRTKEDAAD